MRRVEKVDDDVDVSSIVCSTCGSGEEREGDEIVLCDGVVGSRSECPLVGYHQWCHVPPIFVLPRGSFTCSSCRSSPAGSDLKEVKSIGLRLQLERLVSTVKQCLSKMATCEDTIRTYTTTKRNTDLLKAGKVPSELLGARVRMFRAQVEARRLILALDSYITGPSRNGEPRFDSVGTESDSDESGIDPQEIICWLCRDKSGDDADDNDNDVLLCDGQGCFRAFHMKCVSPVLTQDYIAELGDDDNWLCPFCDARADLIHLVNEMYFEGGDIHSPSPRKRGLRSPLSPLSPKSKESLVWDDPEKIFAGSQEQYHHALEAQRTGYDAELCEGVQNENVTPNRSTFGSPNSQDSDTSDEEYDDDVPIDSLDDEAGSDQNSDSDSGESGIDDGLGKNELSMLSDVDDDDDDLGNVKITRALRVKEDGQANVDRIVAKGNDDRDALEYVRGLVTLHQKRKDRFTVVFEDDTSIIMGRGELQLALIKASMKEQREREIELARRSKVGGRRTVNHIKIKNPDDLTIENIGDFDEANIIHGKRRRGKVDYRNLNDALFGSYSPSTATKLFGDESKSANEWKPPRESSKKSSTKESKKASKPRSKKPCKGITRTRGEAVSTRSSKRTRTRNKKYVDSDDDDCDNDGKNSVNNESSDLEASSSEDSD